MTARYQNQFPFNLGTLNPPPGTLLFEPWQTGNGQGWAVAPGLTPVLPGTQFPASVWRKWDVSATWPPGTSLDFVDVQRQALVLQALPPAVEGEAHMAGLTRLIGAWGLEAAQFYLQVLTRFGSNQMQEAVLDNGRAGMLFAIDDLAGTTDGPFMLLGVRERSGGLEACASKWTDHETIGDEYSSGALTSSEVYVRALLLVDPEDGVALRKAEWSTGFGWRSLFGSGDELLLDGENTALCVGSVCHSYREGASAPSISFVQGPMVVGPPMPGTAQTQFELVALSQGGRNWPGGA